MAYYYVKSGLTGTGDQGRYASQQTGAFPTGTGGYPDLQTAIDSSTTPPAHGDFICISDASAYSAAATSSLDTIPTGAGAGLTIVCVDDSNCENAAIESVAALEITTGGAADYDLNATDDGTLTCYGLYIASDDDLRISGYGSKTTLIECTLEVSGNGDALLFGASSNYGHYINFYNCHFKFSHTGALLKAQSNSNVKFIGGQVTGKTDLFDSSAGSLGGLRWEFIGTDLSAITDSILNDPMTASTDGPAIIKLVRCQLASGVEFVDSINGTLKWSSRVEAYNSAHDSTAEWQFYVREEACDAEATSSTYRNQSVAWPVTGSKTSIAVDTATSGNATVSRPFTFDLPSRYAALSSTATDLITVYLSGQAGLTDKDVWAVAVYPDGTNAHVPNHEVSSSLTNYADAFDPFRTGSALTTDTGSTWTSGGAANYRIEIDTSGDPGTDSVPIIRIFVADLSATLYIDSQVDLS